MGPLRFRLSVRTLVELVALAAVLLGARRAWREVQPPWPSVRALQRGDEAARVAAVRDLGLAGDVGVDAIPALLAATRDDPSPAVRRGAIHALTMIALASPPADLPIDAVLAGPKPPGPPSAPPPRPPAPPPTRLLRPGADRAALGLVGVMRADAEPSVRVYALRGLRKILNEADAERQRARGGTLAPSAPTLVSAGPWPEAAAHAVAELVHDPEPEVRGHAIGFLLGSRPGKSLLTDREQIDTLRPLVADGAPRLPAELDVIVLNNLAYLVGPASPDAPALIDLLCRRMAGPRPADDKYDEVRTACARMLWHLVATADTLREHPDAAELLVSLLGDRQAAYRGDFLMERTNPFTADHFARRAGGGGGASWSGGLRQLPEPRVTALAAIARAPRLLGVIWPRVDRAGRLEWLAGTYSAGDWNAALNRLADPRTGPDLPPEESAAILARLLDEPGPSEDEEEPQSLRQLIEQVEQGRRGGEPRKDAPPPIEVAREIRDVRNLAVLAYFARGAGPGEGADRVAERLAVLLGSTESQVRQRAAEVLGTLGSAADPARPALETMAEADPDEAARTAAETALRRLDGEEVGVGDD